MPGDDSKLNYISEIGVLKEIEESNLLLDNEYLIEYLKKFENEMFFYPKVAFRLYSALQKSGYIIESELYLRKLFDSNPEYSPAWSHILKDARGTDQYSKVCSGIIDQFLENSGSSGKWVWPILTEAALAVRNDKSLLAIMKLRSNKYITGEQENLIAALNRFLVGIELKDFKDYNYWNYTFSSTDRECFARDKCLFINLSHLRGVSVSELDIEVVRIFSFVIRSMLRAERYLLDYGILAWKGVEKQDAHTAILWRLLSSIMDGAGENGERFPVPVVSISKAELWVRGGIVEYRALWHYLENPHRTSVVAEDVVSRADRCLISGESYESGRGWWARFDAAEDILRLNTNAGWYAKPGLGAAAFEDWATWYRKALCSGELIFAAADGLLGLAALIPELRNKTISKWSEREGFRVLDGGRVVFVTAYAQEIAEQHSRENIQKIWRTAGVQHAVPREIDTVQAPMSVWPYYPDMSWSETFSKLCQECSAAVERINADVFVASCGAYGLPITSFIHEKYGITSVYQGHMMNMYFGVATNGVEKTDIYRNSNDINLWSLPDIGKKYPKAASIDGGRYGALDVQ